VFGPLIRKYLLDNKHRVSVEMLPDKGLGAQREAVERERLAAARTAMGPEDVQAVIRETQELRERQVCVQRLPARAWLCQSRVQVATGSNERSCMSTFWNSCVIRVHCCPFEGAASSPNMHGSGMGSRWLMGVCASRRRRLILQRRWRACPPCSCLISLERPPPSPLTSPAVAKLLSSPTTSSPTMSSMLRQPLTCALCQPICYLWCPCFAGEALLHAHAPAIALHNKSASPQGLEKCASMLLCFAHECICSHCS
jgi:hypothetical protein